MTPQEVCEKAADYIEAHGWCTQMYESNDGSVCALGAMRKVVWPNLPGDAGTPIETDAFDLFTDAWSLLGERVGSHVPYWNDYVAMSKERVIEQLREAALS